MSKGLKKLHVIEKKQQIEADFTAWVNQDEARKALYGNALMDIQTAVEGRAELQVASSYMIEAYFLGMETVMFGRNLRELEMTLADPEPDQEQITKITTGLKESAERFYKDYNPSTDKKIMTAMVNLMIDEVGDEYLPSTIFEVKTK